MTWKTARQRAEWESAAWNILFFPGADFCPGMKKVRLEKKQALSELSKEQMKENRTPGDESGGQENVFRPPPLNSRLRLTPPPSLPPVNPLASLFYLSFPLCHSLPSHLLMRSLAYTCALTVSLSFPLSPPAAVLLFSSSQPGSFIRVPPSWTEKHAQPF